MAELTIEEKKELLGLARKTLIEYVLEGKIPNYTPPHSTFEEKSGCFVTLRKKGRLRGCVGHICTDKPLYQTVIASTIAAAAEDPRFSPVRQEELDGIRIEISVLSPARTINTIEEVEVGVHGLLISKNSSRGLLLPQVATEYNWDKITFLEQACLKAGLSRQEWKRDACIEVFTAQVFGEEPQEGGRMKAEG